MKVITDLASDFTHPMEKYRAWVMLPSTQARIERILAPQRGKTHLSEINCGLDCLNQIDHLKHEGWPNDFFGINLNSQILRKHLGEFDSSFVEEAGERSDALDDELCNLLGAQVCALKMYYPPGGFIQWHTNWDSPGYNVIFTHSATGKGFWRHIQPNETSLIPASQNLIEHVDPIGWHCKAGYFGGRAETNRVVWHAAHTSEPRLTLSYIIYEKALWDNLVSELAEGEDV